MCINPHLQVHVLIKNWILSQDKSKCLSYSVTPTKKDCDLETATHEAEACSQSWEVFNLLNCQKIFWSNLNSVYCYMYSTMYISLGTDPCKMEDITWRKVPLFTDCACTLFCLSMLVVLPILLVLTLLICSGLFERLNSNGLYTSKLFSYSETSYSLPVHYR